MSLKPLDALDMEFQYYSCLIKELVTMLPAKFDQILANAWCRKLSEPLYNAEALRGKRNHYLLMLTICMTLNSLRYPFSERPNEYELNELPCLVPHKNKVCGNTTDEREMSNLHENKRRTEIDNVGKVLDEQFKFLISLSEPRVVHLSDPADRRRAHQWISFLKSIDSHCLHTKGVRNDYSMLLSGYIFNEELSGPFLRPPIEKLISLENLAKIEDVGNNMTLNPAHPKTLKFLRDLPQPEDGAFAFIAVSGDLCNGATP